jgi:hypothetical protein
MNVSWDFPPHALNLKRYGEALCLLGHAIAIACAIGGLYLIVADSLDAAIYGVILFGLAIGLDVVVASRCNDKGVRRREVPHPRIVNIRAKKKRSRAKR